jgi:hypothetical protein
MTLRRALAGALLLLALTAADSQAQRRRTVRHPFNPQPEARALSLQVLNQVLGAYENADFSSIWSWMDANPRATENSLYAVIPPTRAFAYVVKYENEQPDPADIDQALELLEFSVDRYDLWGRTWLSNSVVNFHVLVAHRLLQHTELPGPARNRVLLLWQSVQLMAQLEADANLVTPLPWPSDSSTTGDSKAEEFAWRTTDYAAAILANGNHVNAGAWDGKMRQMAYDSITRPSDPPDAEGLKFTTVTEDFRLDNHNVQGNPYYAIATPHLLLMAALCYRVQGVRAPAELEHNVKNLYEVYKTYCSTTSDGQFYWNRHSDPGGDPTLFPFGLGNEPERDLALARARLSGRVLWGDPPGAGPIPEKDFFTTVQNHKVGLYYAVGLYLWYHPVVATN